MGDYVHCYTCGYIGKGTINCPNCGDTMRVESKNDGRVTSDLVIIAECGCPTPEWNTCNGCGACKDCCDCYGCTRCGQKGELEDTGDEYLCQLCVEDYERGE